MMPGKNGYRINEIIKGDDSTKHIPVIAFTANAMKEEMKTILEQFEGCLLKPLLKKELVKELSRFLPCRASAKKSDFAADSAAQENQAANLEFAPSANARLIHQLEQEIVPLWENVHDLFFVDDILDFAQQLRQVAREHGDGLLSDYGEKLYEYAQYNRIDDMESLLAAFPGMMDSLRRRCG